MRVTPLVLISFAFFDEFASGVPAVGAFALREGFGSDVTSLAFAVLVLPQLLSLGIEPALVLWAGRRHRTTALAVALGGMALSLGLASLAPDLVSFGLAFAAYAPASGVALGLAEASLMDQRSSDRERTLTQWTLAGTLGDLAAPLLLWGLAVFGFGWRVALGSAGLALGVVSLGLFRSRPAGVERAPLLVERGPCRPLVAVRTALAAAWRSFGAVRAHTRLVLWLCATASCAFMDEALFVLVGLRVYGDTGNEALVAQSLLAFTVGGCCGLLLLERGLRSVRPTALLVIACVGSALGFSVWIECEVTLLSSGWLALAGAFTTAHYPLTLARAYAALPEDSTLVAATAQAFGAFDLAVPLALGLVADRFGIGAALCLLLAQPIGILVATWCGARGNLHVPQGGGTLGP